MIKPRKPKKCKVCGSEFIPRHNSTMQKVCSGQCALVLVKAEKEKKVREEQSRTHKARLRDVKPLSWFAKKAQKAFNEFIRERDKNQPCISCQKHHTGQYHAGHYKTVGAKSQLRFNEDNCHKQCSVCNNHLSGNLAEYRINLINKIGLKRVEALEDHNEPVKYDRDDYENIEKHYKSKLKALKHESS